MSTFIFTKIFLNEKKQILKDVKSSYLFQFFQGKIV